MTYFSEWLPPRLGGCRTDSSPICRLGWRSCPSISDKRRCRSHHKDSQQSRCFLTIWQLKQNSGVLMAEKRAQSTIYLLIVQCANGGKRMKSTVAQSVEGGIENTVDILLINRKTSSINQRSRRPLWIREVAVRIPVESYVVLSRVA